jgi:hypothetical protein
MLVKNGSRTGQMPVNSAFLSYALTNRHVGFTGYLHPFAASD